MNKKWKIKTQLIFLQVASVVLSMGLCSISLLFYDLSYFDSEYKKKTKALLETISHNLETPLEFLDFREAKKSLEALHYHDDYLFAVIKGPKSEVLVRYANPRSTIVISENADIDELSGEFDVFKKSIVSSQGILLGELYLFSTKQSLYEHRNQYVVIFSAIFFLSLLFSSAFGSYAQRPISRVLSGLADTAREISEKSDYSKRFNFGAKDKYVAVEIRTLVQKFNDMIDLIQRRESQIIEANSELEQKVMERTRELHDAQEQALVSARFAGMAEVANNVLHNIGNVLTSIVVSTNEIKRHASSSDMKKLIQSVKLLSENKDKLEEFREEGKLEKLISYMSSQIEKLGWARSSVLEELNFLADRVEHVSQIISAQQTYAKGSSFFETVDLESLIDSAINISLGRKENNQYKIQVSFENTAPESIVVDKHKVIQILVNLISNAKHAVLNAGKEDKRIAIKSEMLRDQLKISVVDNGEGISGEDRDKIFRHGFTTKKHGNGFGLHSCAIAAQEMGGVLQFESSGKGQGACFDLTLPLKSAA